MDLGPTFAPNNLRTLGIFYFPNRPRRQDSPNARRLRLYRATDLSQLPFFRYDFSRVVLVNCEEEVFGCEEGDSGELRLSPDTPV